TREEREVGALESLLLGRTASSAEVNGWQGALAVAGRSSVAAAFLHSGEYRSDVIEAYYTGLLQRSTAPSLAEVNAWVSSGLDLLAIRIGFEASQEYRSHPNGAGSPTTGSPPSASSTT